MRPGRGQPAAPRASAAVALALALTGCFSYVPVELDSVPAGESVRVYLTREGMARLQELAGAEVPLAEQPVVTGMLARRENDRFSLLIPVGSRQTGFLQSQIGQQVTLPRSAAVQVERRRVDGARTALAVATGTGAIAALVIAIIRDARDPLTEEPPPNGDFRIPWLSVPLP